MSEQTTMEEILAVNDVPAPEADDKASKPEAEAETPEQKDSDTSAVAESPEAEKSDDDKADDKPSTVPHEALHAERERRKDLEKRFNKLTSQVGALLPHLAKEQNGAAPKAEEKPEVSFSEDPEGFIVSRLNAIEQAGRQEAATRFFDMSEANARRRHGSDVFQAAFDWFNGAAKAEPALIQKLNQQPDPAEWIMTTYNNASEVAKVSDPSYRENLEKELRAKWEAEKAEADAKAAEEAEAEAAKTVPQPRKSLATARSVTGRTGKAQHTGPTPIDDILSKDR